MCLPCLSPYFSFLPPPSPLSPSPVPGAKKHKGQPVNFSDGLPPLLAKARGIIYVSQPLTSLSLCLTLRAYCLSVSLRDIICLSVSHCMHIVSLSHTACRLSLCVSHCVHIVSLSQCMHIESLSHTACRLCLCLTLRAYCLSVSHCVHIVSLSLGLGKLC